MPTQNNKITTVINNDNKDKLNLLLLSKKNLNNNGLENNTKRLRCEQFKEEQLIASWIAFTHKIPHQPDIHYIFNKRPEINGTEIKVVVTSSIVEQKLQENMSILKQHLCNDIKNDYINITIELDKTAIANLNLTQEEKLAKLIQKNSSLKTLLQEWKLKLY
jgi:hypothetical protein